MCRLVCYFLTILPSLLYEWQRCGAASKENNNNMSRCSDRKNIQDEMLPEKCLDCRGCTVWALGEMRDFRLMFTLIFYFSPSACSTPASKKHQYTHTEAREYWLRLLTFLHPFHSGWEQRVPSFRWSQVTHSQTHTLPPWCHLKNIQSSFSFFCTVWVIYAG